MLLIESRCSNSSIWSNRVKLTRLSMLSCGVTTISINNGDRMRRCEPQFNSVILRQCNSDCLTRDLWNCLRNSEFQVCYATSLPTISIDNEVEAGARTPTSIQFRSLKVTIA